MNTWKHQPAKWHLTVCTLTCIFFQCILQKKNQYLPKHYSVGQLFSLLNSWKHYRPGQHCVLSAVQSAIEMFCLTDSRCRCTTGLANALSGEAGSILFPHDAQHSGASTVQSTTGQGNVPPYRFPLQVHPGACKRLIRWGRKHSLSSRWSGAGTVRTLKLLDTIHQRLARGKHFLGSKV